MRKYRGKYPTRIREIWSQGGQMFCKTNDGVLYWIDPIKANHKLPKLGQDATECEACILQTTTF